MFISGAGASAIGSRYSGGLKTGMGVSGYSGDIARVGIRGRATDSRVYRCCCRYRWWLY